MKLFIESDSLKALSSFGREAVPLVPVSNTAFSRVDSPAVNYSFSSTKEDTPEMQVDFGGAIFYFEKVQLEEYPDQHLEDYIGEYYSAELDVHYALEVQDGQLVLNYPNNQGLILKEGVTDTFGANRRTKYSFHRNSKGKIISFEVASEGTVKDILFEKTTSKPKYHKE